MDHHLYKEAHNNFTDWLCRARKKVPSMKQRPVSDKLVIDSAVAPLEALLNLQAQGELLLEHLQLTGEVAIASTSPQGQENICNEIRALRENFEGLFKEIRIQKEPLEATVLQWRDYKEEHDRLCDWLQQIDIHVKTDKTALLSTLKEKTKQVQDVKDILEKLEKEEEQIEKLNKSAAGLLSSHLDTYINNQLRHLNSRYQELLRKREQGRNLIHMTVTFGDKVLCNTRSDGCDLINNQLKEIQNDWDRLVKKISTAKVHLETSLLQWADYSSSYSELQQWITDREAKLQQVCEQKVLESEQGEGQKKLEKALEQGDVACQIADPEDNEIIEEEVALLQEEFDTDVDSLSNTKNLVKVGIVRWTENDQYQEDSEWLNQTEQVGQTFNTLQHSLEEKKNVVEQFQMINEDKPVGGVADEVCSNLNLEHVEREMSSQRDASNWGETGVRIQEAGAGGRRPAYDVLLQFPLDLCKFKENSQWSLYPADVVDYKHDMLHQILPTSLKSGTNVDILVTCALSPSCLSLQFKGSENTEVLEDLMATMRSFYSQEPYNMIYKMQDGAFKVLQLCVALHDSKFSRAIVTRVFTDEVEIILFDYGTVVTVKKHQVLYMLNDFGRLPLQSVRARLGNIRPKDGMHVPWPPSTVEYLRHQICGQRLTATISSANYREHIVEVVLFDKRRHDGYSVNNLLKYAGFASTLRTRRAWKRSTRRREGQKNNGRHDNDNKSAVLSFCAAN